MTNTKTKRALLLSLLSMLLCVSMLIGTTFAWFTDNVSSVNNIIKSGNLDVELYYSYNAEDWISVEEDDKIFDETALWEPGYTEVVYLKVVNAGSLSLKYQLGVNVYSETEGTNAAGETFKLSDYIEFGTVVGQTTAFASREEARAAVSAGAQIISTGFTQRNHLFAKGDQAGVSEDVVALVVYMPESVDNVANHKTGTVAPQITLGIDLFATQYTYEEDSFDEMYDEEAAVFTVADANALMAKGKDATLVNCNEPAGILEVPADYTGTLTLVNSTVKSVQGAGDVNLVVLGNVVVNAKSAVSTFAATAFDGSAITANGKLSISGKGNLTAIAADETGAFGIGGMNTTEISIKDITVDYASGSFVQPEFENDLSYGKSEPEGGAAIGSGYDGAVITLQGVTVKKAEGGSKAAAIGARYWTGVTVNITDSLIENAFGGNASAGIGGSRVSGDATENGTTINITNSVVSAKGGQFGAGIGSGYDTHCGDKQPLCTINIEGSKISAVGGKYAAGVGSGFHNAALAGEITNSTVHAVSGEKIYKSKYTAAMDIGFGVIDLTREGKQTDSKLLYNGVEITIASAPDVVEPAESLADAIKDNATIQLTGGDYVLPSLSGKTGVTIVGAADGSTKLSAASYCNFGKDTVLKNVTFKSDGKNSVRYGTTSGDVVYENCVFEGKQYGYHVDNANGGTVTFNNCIFYGRNALASTGTYTFNDCTFKYTYSNYNTTNIYSKATFNDCKWDSKLELSIGSGAKAIVDGEEITQRVVFIADARAMESFQQRVNWYNESYAGVTVMLSADIDMKDAYYASWTPIGQTGATQFKGTFDGHGYTIKNLNINTTSQTGGHYSTGLFGWLNSATVKNLTIDTATVTGNHNVGVIAGYMETSGCTISNCHVINATVSAKHANDDACGDKVGVIVGHSGNSGVKVENCSAKDCTVTAGRDAGQITGAALSANVTGCTAANVTVTASGECTGANIRNEIIGRVLG